MKQRSQSSAARDTTHTMAESEPPPASGSLDALRVQIDRLDEQIVALLNQRARVVVEIGRTKQQTGTPVYAPDRERAVLDRLHELNRDGPLPDRCVEAVYRELMSGSFALERPLRIGYLGPAGSFSHAAAVKQFGSSVEHVPLDSIRGVFDEVARGHIDYGLAPVENSLQGGIIETLDAFVDTHARVCAEVLIAVRHNLLAKEPWERVRRICSKPEVFAQCRKWLASAAEGRVLEPAPSTSQAARLAATEPGVAAIGSILAGEIYGLHALFENIEDSADNITRFFVIGRETARPTGRDKTAIMFTTGHAPGALADVLDVFKSSGINLTDIEKRPTRRQNWEYCFFVDAEGHQNDQAMQKAVDEAKRHCLHLSVLGSYPRAGDVL